MSARGRRARGAARFEGGAGSSREELVVVEEPLEIRIDGDPIAVTMRTPGSDRELAIGFLFAEGVVVSREDVGTITHCGRMGDPARENTMDVRSGAGITLVPPEERGTTMTSSCGVCGRRSLDDLLERVRPIPIAETLEVGALTEVVARLGAKQTLFAETGGCHAASLWTFAGEHVCTYEDVGRHNAVDKVVGDRVIAGAFPLAAHVLVVSGRSSFEIVHKAAVAGIPIVASVSAPSTLAIDLAERAGITLCGFVRGKALTAYTNPTRLTRAPGRA